MLLEATSAITSGITDIIAQAAKATGVNFDYLLNTAQRESNLDPSAKASNSSATGLFQFIDQTWLETVKTAGPALGYGRYAEAIQQTASGQYTVPDAAQRKAVMNLRTDPAAAAAMAGAFTQRNAAVLTDRLGRAPTNGELYIAHFLGSGGAAQFIAAKEAAPNSRAAALFPDAARANRAIFYNRDGSARTMAQVYGRLTSQHGPSAVSQVAAANAASQTANSRKSAVAAVAAVTPPVDDLASVPLHSFATDEGPAFHNLFRVDRRDAVSPVVAELWGAKATGGGQRTALTANTMNSDVSSAAAPGRPLDLFQFLRPEIRGRTPRVG